MTAATTRDFERIVREEIPLIDVRAPVEFKKGAFPTAVNLPLMDDEERRLVGICYKEHGNAEAVKLGHSLVCGGVKQSRVEAWIHALERQPDALIYCFRGGQRSQISQQWIQAAGVDVPRLEGGYKAFRSYLIRQLEPANLPFTPVILGGRTGTGKTILLQELDNMVDLEGIANHRGSSFGRFTTPQPGQIDFENNLAWAFIRYADRGHQHVVLEDEGNRIGDLQVPLPFREYCLNRPLVILERSLEERVEITYDEYITNSRAAYVQTFGDEGEVRWTRHMTGCIDRIRKRLGGLRHQTAKALLLEGRHRDWIQLLLREYYDPMYDHQIAGKNETIDFQGNEAEVLAYLKQLS